MEAPAQTQPADDLWLNFDQVKERVYSKGPVEGGEKIRITIPQRVLELRDIAPTDEEMAANNPYGTRQMLATQYAAEGDIVDPQIDVWGWGAENTYEDRRRYKYTSTPDIFGRNRIYVPPAPTTLPADPASSSV